MRSVGRFCPLLVGVYPFVRGWLTIHIAIVAKTIGTEAVKRMDNVATLVIGRIIVMSGCLLFRNVLDNALRDES